MFCEGRFLIAFTARIGYTAAAAENPLPLLVCNFTGFVNVRFTLRVYFV